MILTLRQLAAKYGIAPMTQVIHVGGHYGEECEEYLREGATYQAWIEPQLACFLEMKKRIGGSPGVVLYHCALGSFNGCTDMHIERDNAGQSSSVLPPKVHATQYPTIRFTGERERVLVMRADDLFSQDSFEFIAIDVQGFELEVLHGARGSLRTVRALSIEVNRAELYVGCAMVGDVDNELAYQGFDRVETEWCGETWGEAIYVRRRPPP